MVEYAQPRPKQLYRAVAYPYELVHCHLKQLVTGASKLVRARPAAALQNNQTKSRQRRTSPSHFQAHWHGGHQKLLRTFTQKWVRHSADCTDLGFQLQLGLRRHKVRDSVHYVTIALLPLPLCGPIPQQPTLAHTSPGLHTRCRCSAS